jgi:hypothetical protein
MSEKTVKVRTLTSIVNPAHKSGGSAEAVFAAGAEVTVPESLANAWLADGRAEAVEAEEATEEKADKKKK